MYMASIEYYGFYLRRPIQPLVRPLVHFHRKNVTKRSWCVEYINLLTLKLKCAFVLLSIQKDVMSLHLNDKCLHNVNARQ